MLAAIVERILPENFYSPSLLPSRACPLVLLDYVQEYTPKLYAHSAELGVDLAAICFFFVVPPTLSFYIVFISDFNQSLGRFSHEWT